MEQTNLVVTPDGKSWDEVTRDVGYIGNVRCMMNTDTETSWQTTVIFDEWRGDSGADNRNHCNKDFAIAYDRIICLKDGQYRINSKTRTNGTNQQGGWHMNGTAIFLNYIATSAIPYLNILEVTLKRGDYLQLKGEFGYDSLDYNYASIEKI